jgi:hypothetical protein
MYAIYFPLMALARYARATGASLHLNGRTKTAGGTLVSTEY